MTTTPEPYTRLWATDLSLVRIHTFGSPDPALVVDAGQDHTQLLLTNLPDYTVGVLLQNVGQQMLRYLAGNAHHTHRIESWRLAPGAVLEPDRMVKVTVERVVVNHVDGISTVDYHTGTVTAHLTDADRTPVTRGSLVQHVHMRVTREPVPAVTPRRSVPAVPGTRDTATDADTTAQ